MLLILYALNDGSLEQLIHIQNCCPSLSPFTKKYARKCQNTL